MVRKAALVLSGLLVLAWAVLVATVDPSSDANAVLDYVNLTFLLVVALTLVWLIVLLLWIGHRFANRSANPS